MVTHGSHVTLLDNLSTLKIVFAAPRFTKWVALPLVEISSDADDEGRIELDGAFRSCRRILMRLLL